MALLTKIQTALLEGGELAPILLQLRFLAARLGSDALEEWVKFESEGYPEDVEVPGYRRFSISYTGSFNGPFGKMATNLPIPPALVLQHAGERWVSHPERQSVGALEGMLTSSASTGSNFQIDASNLILIMGAKVFTGMACHQVTGSISRGEVVGLMNTLRARVLELSIQLEDKIPGVMDVDVSQGPKASEIKEYAMVTNNITNNTVHGNQNTTSISNSGAGAQFTVEVHQGDVGSLTKCLKELGLEPADAAEFAQIVASEQPLDGKEPFGASAKAWLGANISKVADKVGFAVAAQLIGKAVASYYGIGA